MEMRERLNQRLMVNALVPIAKPDQGENECKTVLEAEISFLISRVGGQGDRRLSGLGQDIVALKNESLVGGASGAQVFLAKPDFGSSESKIPLDLAWLVIKIDSLEEIRQEYERYRRYIRFRVSRTTRVECLSVEYANNLGALCYTFAGKSPEKVRHLQDLLQTQDRLAIDAINNLCSPQNMDLHAVATDPSTINIAYSTRFGKRYNPSHVATFLKSLYKKNDIEGGKVLEKSVQLSGLKVGFDDRVLSESILELTEVPCCLSHYDLHSGNVIVGTLSGRDSVESNDLSSILIDYRHTGPAPRCTDFASLEASIRIECSHTLDLSQSLRAINDENLISRAIWSEKPIPKQPLSFWQECSMAVATQARNRFTDLTALEYQATCLAWCLQLFGLKKSLTLTAKARLFAWLSELAKNVEKRSAKDAG